MGSIQNQLVHLAGMSQYNLLRNQRTHRPAQRVCLSYAQRIHQPGGVIRELPDSEGTLTHLGIPHASVVKNDHLETRGQGTDQPGFPQIHSAAVTHDQHQRIPVAVDTIAHLDVANPSRMICTVENLAPETFKDACRQAPYHQCASHDYLHRHILSVSDRIEAGARTPRFHRRSGRPGRARTYFLHPRLRLINPNRRRFGEGVSDGGIVPRRLML